MKSRILLMTLLAKRKVLSASAAVLAACLGLGPVLAAAGDGAAASSGGPASAATTDNVKADTRKAVSNTKQFAADSWITTKVKSEILADDVSKGFNVSATTIDGVVVLQGTLGNRDAIARVREIAERVEGVKAVDTTGIQVQANK